MAIKLTLVQATDLLAKAGVQAVEIVEKDEDSDYTTTAKAPEPVTSDTLLMAIDTLERRGCQAAIKAQLRIAIKQYTLMP